MIAFDTLRERLLSHIRHCVQNGETTERRLARDADISQPHLHNLLKGVRSLNTRSADQLLSKLGLNALDLLEPDELRHALFRRSLDNELSIEVPVLQHRLGPGLPWPDELSMFERVKVPVSIASRIHQPVVARLNHDPAMDGVLNPGDLILLDNAAQAPEHVHPATLFAIETNGRVAIRWLRYGRGCLYLVDAIRLNHPREWEVAPRCGILRARVIPLRSTHEPEIVYDPLLPRDKRRVPAPPYVSS